MIVQLLVDATTPETQTLDEELIRREIAALDQCVVLKLTILQKYWWGHSETVIQSVTRLQQLSRGWRRATKR